MGSIHQLRTPAFEKAELIVEAAGPLGVRGSAKGQAGPPAGFFPPPASADPLASGLTVEGAVKWFNAEKGYGFVALADGRGDAFLHLKTLRQIGRETLPSGAKLRAVVSAGPRGAHVVQIVEVDTTSAIERSSRRHTPDPSTAFDLTGRVKWFDVARGFGFVASDDFGKDVFVHSSTLGVSGVVDLFEGQTVSMRVVETPKGREAITIIVQ
jgi:CspA family cold shock protein